MRKEVFIVCLAALGFAACSKTDEIEPVIQINSDNSIHYRGDPYEDNGAVAADNYTCNLSEEIETVNLVDTSKYGTYDVIYLVTDDAGNSSEAVRRIDIVLPPDDYYSLSYHGVDSCTTGNYSYTALIQNCNCGSLSVTVGNISNFGLSASFTLPLSGTYNQIITLDTTKADVYFLGTGIMSPAADVINWQYSITDSVSTDVCTSTWVKE